MKMGHGTSVLALLDVEASPRMKRIPAYLLPTVRGIAKDIAYEIYDLMKIYYGDGYPPHAGVINGKCNHRTLRDDSWKGSDIYEEIGIAIAEAREKAANQGRK